MSEDTKSIAAANRARGRFLYIANPGSDNSSDEEDKKHIRSQPEPSSSYPQSYVYQPPALPHPTALQPRTHPNTHSPPKLTTDFTQDHPHPPPQSSQSTTNLSSPSSTSSHAIDTTPPPSTPGVLGPSYDLGYDGSGRQEPYIGGSNTSERDEGGQISSRPTNFLDKIKARIPHRQARPTRASPNHHQDLSPTVSTPDSYTPSVGSQSGRSAPLDQIRILVTTDADQYLLVDTFGSSNGAAIRERIFTKLHVSDEDQRHYSIYRTKVGSYALGDALSDEALYSLCSEQGDAEGSLRFFVSHTSAPVHETPPPPDSFSPPIGSTIPPPVLPLHNGAFPLRPQRRDTRSRHGSVSSASERLPQEANGGYDASISDDLDHADRDVQRSAARPHPSKVATFRNVASSPDRARRSGSSHRPRSPLYTMPQSGSNREMNSDLNTVPADSRAHVATSPCAIPSALSPVRTSFDDNTLVPPILGRHRRSPSDAAAEREHALEVSENQLERQWQQHQQRDDRTTVDRAMGERSGLGIDVGQHDQQVPSEINGPSDKQGVADPWVLLAETSSGKPRPSAELVGKAPRYHLYSPFRGTPYAGRPATATSPRTAAPTSQLNPRPASSRGAGQPVPSSLVVTWKAADTKEPKAPASTTAQWGGSRLAAKSMNDLRNPQRSNPLPQPNHQDSVPIPSINARREGSREASATHISPSSKSYEPRAGLRPLPKHAAPPQNSSPLNSTYNPPAPYGARRPVPPHSFSTNTNYANAPPTTGDPYSRPGSATRYQSRFGNEVDDVDNFHSPSPPLRQASTSSRMGYGREDSPSTSQSFNHGLRVNPNVTATRSPEASRIPPRSPASPRSPQRNSRPNTSDDFGLSASTPTTSFAANIQQGIDSNETLRQENRDWIRQMLDGHSDSVTLVPKAADIGQSPMRDPPQEPSPPRIGAVFDPYASTLVNEEDSDSDDGLWQKKPGGDSNTHDKPVPRVPVPALTVQTDPVYSPPPPSSFRRNPPIARDYSTQPNRSVNDQWLNPRSVANNKAGHRGSTFTDNEQTWAPRPAPEEVYERLEDFFPEHDLDKPVIEAGSGAGSPTATENPAPPLPEKDKSDKGLRKAKKSIRIVAEEHKKRIDRTSRADNFASVLRKRSTKLWGSRLEEVTTEQARAEQARALYTASSPESPSGGPRPIFKWVRGELIGKGTYGRVYLALNATTGEMIAVKQVEIPQTASDKADTRQAIYVKALKLESETLKDLDHPNVVQYLGFEETPNFLSIFLEYVPGGSIGSCLVKHGKFEEDVTKSFTEQILTGLEYLHSKNILHRDLKADNILVETSGVCKITDFGISKRTDDINGMGASTAMQGTVFWMAPEVIDTNGKGYGKKIDIWSVGCVVLEMWAGKRPWSGDEAIAVILKLHKSKLPPPVPDDVVLSPMAHNFRNLCFAINPEERPSAAQLRKHPYLELPPSWTFPGFGSDV